MSRLLQRIGGFSARRRWWVLAGWVLILFAVAVGAKHLSKPMESAITVPGVQSYSTLNRINSEFPSTRGNGGQIVFAAPKGKRLTAADAATVATLAKRAAAVRGVTSAPDPFDGPKAQFSSDGRIGYISVTVPGADTAALQKGIGAAIHAAGSSSLQVAASSGLTAAPSSGLDPLPGIIIGFVILFVAFASLLTAGLPLIGALIGLGVSLETISIASGFLTLNSDTPDLAILLGLAVGIDYSLFIINRHRRGLLEGMSVPDSIARAVGTAGSAVVFAAFTVVIALAGLAVERVGVLTQMGLAAAGAVVIALLISLTLTPALLGFARLRILGGRARKRIRAGDVAPRRVRPKRWTRTVAKRPVLFLIGSVAVLLVLAAPVTTMRLGLPNAGDDPTSSSDRQAFDLMAEGWGPGINGPLLALAEYPSTPTEADGARAAAALEAVKDVKQVTPLGAHGNDVLFEIVPKTGPSDAATVALVDRLRGQIHGAPKLLISGVTAVTIDISAQLAAQLPLYLLLVIGLAFILLLIAFRSILVPLKAMIGFGLSLAATFGVTVAVFQWGWFGSILGVDPPAPLLCLLPTIAVGVLFGLSMDYEMFLMSGIREEYVLGADARTAVQRGLASGTRVVVAAGLIMIAIFGNGAVTGIGTLKVIAFSLGIGVLFDAFIVRTTFVPAVMFLLGRAAWWLPGWLNRILPDIDVEGANLTEGGPHSPALQEQEQ